MKSIANMCSNGACAMSGYLYVSAIPLLLLARPHISAPGVSGPWRTRH